jgi:uncharacterized paraquat-inducible protein A
MNDPQKHTAKVPSPQYSKCYCNKCYNLVFMKWIEYGKRKKCPECHTEFVLVGNEWKPLDGQQGVLL